MNSVIADDLNIEAKGNIAGNEQFVARGNIARNERFVARGNIARNERFVARGNIDRNERFPLLSQCFQMKFLNEILHRVDFEYNVITKLLSTFSALVQKKCRI